MTKKHYEMVAGTINKSLLLAGYNPDTYIWHKEKDNTIATLLHLVSNLAEKFEDDNKLFQRDKFIAACKQS